MMKQATIIICILFTVLHSTFASNYDAYGRGSVLRRINRNQNEPDPDDWLCSQPLTRQQKKAKVRPQWFHVQDGRAVWQRHTI